MPFCQQLFSKKVQVFFFFIILSFSPNGEIIFGLIGYFLFIQICCSNPDLMHCNKDLWEIPVNTEINQLILSALFPSLSFSLLPEAASLFSVVECKVGVFKQLHSPQGFMSVMSYF